MNRALLKKSLFESLLLLVACAIAVYALCFLHVWFVSRLELSEFAKVIEPLWKKYNKFSPVSLDQLLTYPGRIARAYSEPMVTLCIAVWAIARGSDVVSGEVGRGSMEMLLSQPVSRVQVLLHHLFRHWYRLFFALANRIGNLETQQRHRRTHRLLDVTPLDPSIDTKPRANAQNNQSQHGHEQVMQ